MILAGLAVTGVFAFVIRPGAGNAGVPVVPVFDGNGGFMRTCILAPQGRVRACYIRRLLTEIEKSHDPPERDCPALSRRVVNRWLRPINCHMMMPSSAGSTRVGTVTLANLLRLPRSTIRVLGRRHGARDGARR
jgi:hypothetical protein